MIDVDVSFVTFQLIMMTTRTVHWVKILAEF